VTSAACPTRVACLTPSGTAAIATLALRGPAAWDLVRDVFRPHSRSGARLPPAPEPGRIWVGRLAEPSGGGPGDEAVLAVRGVEPWPCLEVHSHGGAEVVRWVLDLFQTRGACACSWQEFEARTSGDTLRALALAELARAPTVRTAAVLLDQFHGALRQAVEAARAAIGAGDAAGALVVLDQLAHHAALGRHLTVPWQVAVLGAPNVGKSSLVNALAGYQRAVVAETPGTTRDVVCTLIALDGWPVEVSDTAGLREAAGPLEAEGMARARAAGRAADLCLWLLDAAAPPVWPPPDLSPVFLVVNKVDLPPAWDPDAASGAVRVSARTGVGLPELCAAVVARVVPEAPPARAAVPFTAGIADRIEEARRLCREGRRGEAQQVLARLST
jgi:tRNA modification GTPase